MLHGDRSQLLKGTLDVALLTLLRGGDDYGQALFARLVDAGLPSVADASVYGALRRLERDRLLTSELVPSNDGPARKYYGLTSTGRSAEQAGREAWEELVTAMARLMGGRP
jgi:PadR family transcriptional regulator PadR